MEERTGSMGSMYAQGLFGALAMIYPHSLPSKTTQEPESPRSKVVRDADRGVYLGLSTYLTLYQVQQT